MVALSHLGMTTDEFVKRVEDWMATARHPRFNRPYNQLTYEPQQQLLSYLRANGFRTYIVSGGGADFMRVFSERVYGIPPEQVVGSTGTVKFENAGRHTGSGEGRGLPCLSTTKRASRLASTSSSPGGPSSAPATADGDQAMLEYTTIGNTRPSLGVLIHHTDAAREYAYDANPPSSGKLLTALQEAGPARWTVVDMKIDWNTVFADDHARWVSGRPPHR
jgi:hypothetical protein